VSFLVNGLILGHDINYLATGGVLSVNYSLEGN
jgi:hypothetical protein